MKTRAQRSNPTTPSRVRAIALAALAIGAPTGCGREFFRQWANQDSSQAVFEKSRDPRWRLDLFSIEPPAMSRFGDPYDQDTPPAPPDDFATQATSPVPQWPNNRMLVPVEGTGYIDILERGPHYSAQPPRDTNPSAESAPAPYTGTTAPPPVPPVAPSPFGPGENPGPDRSGLSPNPVPAVPGVPAAPVPPEPTPPEAGGSKLDLGVRLAAFQETGLPMPVPPAGPSPEVPPGPRRDLDTPPIGMDPNPTNPDLSVPIRPPFGQTPEQFRAAEAAGSEMAGLFVPGEIDFNEAEAAGLPRGSHPYVLTLEQSFNLALINSRTYQFNIENIYIAALNVTLQRFAFQPQFFAGLSPQTGVAGRGGIGGSFPPFVTGLNQFTYATRATGAPASSLSLTEAAGVGKLFSTGGQILAGFANQLVFNFLGKHPIQPRVQSFLPLNIIQPFLRGGGRAVTLEALTQAERNLLYQIRQFAKFRQEFIVANLVGGSIPNFASSATNAGYSGNNSGNTDPVVGFLNVVQDIQQIENDRKNLAAFEQLKKVYTELILGESSGLTRLQLDQIDSNVQRARQQLVSDKTNYRNALDQLKTQFGMPPDIPLILDRSLTRAFKDVFDGIDVWQRDPRRNLEDLPKFAARLPDLQDVNLDGRSVLSVYKEGSDNEDALENILLAGERIALERRLDLMNARAQLYDAWRQIRFTANALRGVLNVALTNTFVTQPATTNPFAFVDQAKQFSLVINAELPLVRVNERNLFRTALINYQRARRTLQFTEDFIKLQIRSDIRGLQTSYLTYEISRRNFVLTVRQKDQAFEQIIAPPQGGGGGAASSNNVGQVAQAATQTTNLINFQTQLLGLENTLVQNWLQYVTARLILFRDLGTLPYDEWEAYHELFPANPPGPPGTVGAEGIARTTTAPTTEVVPR